MRQPRQGWPWPLAVCAMLVLAAPGRAAITPVTVGDRSLDRFQVALMWDPTYLYFAAKVQDINVTGTHTDLGEPVSDDDDVELYFDRMPGARTGADRHSLYPGCFQLAMSAAEGVYFARGGGEAEKVRWMPLAAVVPGAPPLREAVKVSGTLGEPGDTDLGWQVECAIPWQAFGLDAPPIGQTWAFNVVRTLRGDADARYSYAPKGLDRDPSTWMPLAFRLGNPGIEAGRSLLVFSTPNGRPPTVDGEVGDSEWPVLIRHSLDPSPSELLALPPTALTARAEKQDPLPAGSTFRPRELPPRTPRQPYVGDGQVLAEYTLALQTDRRQPGALFAADGSAHVAAEPLSGLGPWSSSLRVGPHREALERAAAAGIDVLLVDWPVVPTATSLDALRSLTLAANELATDNQPCPRLAPRLDFSAPTDLPRDLTQQTQQEQLYQALSAFYEQVPPALRAQVADGPLRTCIAALGDVPRSDKLTGSFQRWVDVRFREDYGQDLWWVGTAGWGRRGVWLDAAGTFDQGSALFAGGRERVRLAVISPGRDSSQLDPRAEVTPRAALATLRDEFVAARTTRPDWLLLESWNDVRDGSQIMSTREYGSQTERRAGVLARAFLNPAEQALSVRLSQVNAPSTVAAGAAVYVAVAAANTGLQPWAVSNQVRLSAQWYHLDPTPLLDEDGKQVNDPITHEPVNSLKPLGTRRTDGELLTLDPGRAAPTELTVAVTDDADKPLAPGRYRLRLGATAGTRVEEEPILDAKHQPVKDPKTGKATYRRVEHANVLGTQADKDNDLVIEVLPRGQVPTLAATVIATDLPTRVEAGRLYPVTVTVANDGLSSLPEGCQLGVRYDRIAAATPDSVPPTAQPLTGWMRCGAVPVQPTPDGRRGPAPGHAATWRLKVPTAAEDGSPLAADAADGPICRIEWAVLDRAGRPLPASRVYRHAVEVLARDWGAGFGPVELPRVIQSGASAIGNVTVLNTSFRTWPAKTTEVAWHWYRFDASELKFDAGRVKLPVDLRSGQSVKVPVSVMPPAYTGPLLISFDVVFDGRIFASLQPGTFGEDSALLPVVVTGGPCRPVSLAGLFNVVGHSFDDAPGSGDFDGQGRSLPAELLPPLADDVADGVYPTGWMQLFGAAPLARWGQVVFRYASPWPDVPRTTLPPPPRRGQKPPATTTPETAEDPPPLKPVAAVVRPDGQILSMVPATYVRLHVLGAAVGDDTKAQFGAIDHDGNPVKLPPVDVTTWVSPPRHGETIGLHTSRRNTRAGAEPIGCWLHHITIDLPSDTPLARIVLPRNPNLRILAITLETAPAAVGVPQPRPTG